ncbi:exported hypothetical protein [Alteromonas sp. 38]|uniref:hypothetical protein n=1 Tax=Alteromonas TaxID=226 RepID=UPI0012F373AA|nr:MULTISPECIES: hypothetical protein [Alteromonas]CAD5247783.1 exported hypothetical protein [Alteromonas sp. 154]VXC53328.1 exported hypothetical protein [Alteromonas sp. 38]
MKLKMILNITTFIMLILAANMANAGVNCDRGTIKSVYFTFPKNGEGQVNIYFNDGKGGIWKKVPHHTTNEGLDRLFSAAISYKVANERVTVRYPNLASCNDISSSETDATVTAIWLN